MIDWENLSTSSVTIDKKPNKEGKLRTYLVLKLADEDEHPMMIGLAKARLILKHQDSIKEFVKLYYRKNWQDPPEK